MVERLRAGDLDAVLTDLPELRDLRYCGEIVLDGIALTIRDPDWATVPGHRLDRILTPTDRGVRVAERWRFDLGSGSLLCRLDIRLEEGTVLVAVATEVGSTVAVNRAGLVLLHPVELAGRPVTLIGPEGRREDHFPVRVSPSPPFRDLRGMAYSPADGLTAHLDFGDAPYETEDHRNWGDAGWKSYTPPLAEPVPLRLEAGDRRQQQVRVSLSSSRPSGRPRRSPVPWVRILPETAGVLPAIGWGAGPWPPGRGLPDLWSGPDFLAVEVLATAVGWERLQAAVAQADALAVPLRVTVAVRPAEAAAVAAELARYVGPVSHVCFVGPETHVSDEALVRTAATVLAGTGVAVGAGTRGYLAELGRSASGFADAEFVQLSVSAEVHHDDDERILDTTRALPSLVDTARAVAGGLPLVVAPLTLGQRLSVHRPPGDHYAPWEPAVRPDRRSGEGLGAAWCLASVAGLLGAEALGYFSLAAGHGLVDAAGRPTAAATVLADLAHGQGRPVLRCEVSEPRRVAALAVGDGEAAVLYLANLTAADQEVAVDAPGTPGVVPLAPYDVRRLGLGVPEPEATGSTMDA